MATNAGGLCCVKYGVTTDYVLGMEVVLADGRALRLGGRTVKDVAGYDLKRLFTGSEGTLGVITEVTLRLRPPPPPSTTMVATFPDVERAGRAVTAIASDGCPSVLELMDRTAILAVDRQFRMGLARLRGPADRPVRRRRRAGCDRDRRDDGGVPAAGAARGVLDHR